MFAQATECISSTDVNTIKICVGFQGKTFTVLEEYIIPRSALLTSMKRNGWKNQQNGVVELPDVVPAVFRNYVDLIYHGKFSIPKNVDDLPLLLVKLWALAARLGDECFQNDKVDFVVRRCREYRWYPTDDFTKVIYEASPGPGVTERFLIDLHLVYGERSWVARDPDKNSSQFLYQLNKALLNAACNDFGYRDVRGDLTSIEATRHRLAGVLGRVPTYGSCKDLAAGHTSQYHKTIPDIVKQSDPVRLSLDL
jgi:phenolic acid decarboxylase